MDEQEPIRADLLAELHTLRERVAALEERERAWQQIEETLRQQQAELETLLETGHALATVLDINELLAVIAERVTHLLASDVFVLFQLDDDGETLRPVLALGPSAANVMQTTMRRDQGLTALVFESHEPLVINEAHDDPRAHKIPNDENRTLEAHVMIAPLIVRGHIIGTMVLNRVPGHPFTTTDLRVFTGFVNHVAAALDNVRLYARSQRYAADLELRVQARTAELEQRKDEVEAIFNSVADGMLITDSETVIVSVNPALEQMLDYRAEELIGQNARFFPTTEVVDIPTIEKMWRQVQTQGTLRAEVPIRRRDGSQFDADMSVAALRDDDDSLRGFVVVIRDMTAFKDVQRMKDAFVSNVTHELRTPITNLKLRHDLIEARPERAPQHLPVIQRETERLSRIIDDLLMLSRIDQGRTAVDPQLVNLNQLIAEYVADRASLAESRGLTLRDGTKHRLPPVQADAGLLGQALSIILTNALGYTPAGGTVTIRTVRCIRDNSSWIGIAISDTGPGISPEDRAQVFTRFFRGTAGRESGVSGTGLGLALAQEIVQRHNGWIQVESTGVPGEGTTFTIWLPE